MKVKNDRFRKVRGGKFKILEVQCAACNSMVLIYQKDGDGSLIRCYLNRIFAPLEYEKLQYVTVHTRPQDLPNLACLNCNCVIGTPMQHADRRLAFRLIPGSFKKKLFKKGGANGNAH